MTSKKCIYLLLMTSKTNMQTLYDTESAVFSVFEFRCYSFHFHASITITVSNHNQHTFTNIFIKQQLVMALSVVGCDWRFFSCLSFWLQIQRSRVRSPALPDFLRSSGSGTGSTQPREVNWGATWMKKSSGSRSRKQRLTAVGTRCADHVTPLYPQKLTLTSPTGGGRSVGIVSVRTKATEFSFRRSCW